jgi:hypothetical protein
VGPEAVQDELDALAVRLGRGLTLDDVDGDLVAYSAQGEDADAARISTILSPAGRAPQLRRLARRGGDALLLHRDAGPVAYRAHGPLSPPLDRPRDSLLDSLLDATTEVVAHCLGPGHVCTLGISEPTPFTVRSARAARGQALTAAELAALDPTLPRHSHWAALGVYRHLARSTNAGPEQVLAPLDEAGASGPMLLLTLETYLDLGGDNQATAARLNLHRSSLYYRLNRISDLLAVPLSDGLARLELHLALKSRRAHRRTLR